MRSGFVRAVLGWVTLAGVALFGGALPACGGDDTERAAQSARLASLEKQMNEIGDALAALDARGVDVGIGGGGSGGSSAPVTGQFASTLSNMFKLDCPQPWGLHTALGASLWTCRAPKPTPQGVYAQCSVFYQAQVAIETQEYFEFALNAAPQIYAIKNVKDERRKLGNADAFQGTFEAELKPVPLKAMSALVPHGDLTFTVSCVAPVAVFEQYSPAFRKIMDSFAFK